MMLNLLDSLDKDKYDISVICKPQIGKSKVGRFQSGQQQYHPAPLVKRLKESGYRFIPLSSLARNISPLDIISLIKLYFIFRRYKFDIIHTHSAKTGFVGRIAARLAGVNKIIHTVHGFPFHKHQSRPARILYKLLEKIAAKFCDKIVVVNRFEREEAAKDNLIPSNKMVTIYNGVRISMENQSLKTFPGQLLSVTPAVNLSKCLIIGTVARFTTAKNMVALTEIAVDVCNKCEEILFIFVGDGELFQKCRNIATSHGLDQRIIMPGWQENVKKWLDIFDVFLLYSGWEGLSISILEAMAASLPVIASDIKGNNELITKENGFLVDINNPEGLKALLLSLPSKRNDLAELGRNSLQRVRKHFSHRTFVESYIRLYNE